MEVNSSTMPSNISNATTTSGTSSMAAAQSGIMQKDDFLKLFLASLQFQDPMSPMETKDMMAQMSQLTMVEQITNLGKIVDNLKSTMAKNPLEQGVGYLGKEISGLSEEGSYINGVVDEVHLNNGVLELMVDNKNISIGNISRVANYSALSV